MNNATEPPTANDCSTVALPEWKPSLCACLFPPAEGDPWHTDIFLSDAEYDELAAHSEDAVEGNRIADRILADRGWRRPTGAVIGVTEDRELCFIVCFIDQ